MNFRNGLCALGGLLLALLLVSNNSTAQNQTDETQIAYIASSRSNRQIRTINPDGTDDSLIWEVPEETDANFRLGSLQWKPDGTEIAFTSGHDWRRSMFIEDIYGIAPDGSQIRRITSPPHPDQLDGYAKGGVAFDTDFDIFSAGQTDIYIEGSADFFSFFADPGVTYEFTYDVEAIADLGENVLQRIRVIDWDDSQTSTGFVCRYGGGERASIEIKAGQVIQRGTILFWQSEQCDVAYTPSWSFDGSSLVYINQFGNFRQLPEYPSPTNRGALIFEAPLGTNAPFGVAMGPTEALELDYLAIIQSGSTKDVIFRGYAEDPDGGSTISLGFCKVTEFFCRILDVAWLPDGSGFVFSTSSSFGNKLFVYDFETEESTEIIAYTDDVVGNFSISPDGQTSVTPSRKTRYA